MRLPDCQKGHHGPVNSVAFAPTGNVYATGYVCCFLFLLRLVFLWLVLMLLLALLLVVLVVLVSVSNIFFYRVLCVLYCSRSWCYHCCLLLCLLPCLLLFVCAVVVLVLTYHACLALKKLVELICN